MSNVCQWCSNTSSTIDSMEYQIEQLQRERDALKAKCGEFAAIRKRWNGEPAKDNRSFNEFLEAAWTPPEVCLADIEARAIEGAIENFVNTIGMDEEFIYLADLQGYADELRQQAGGSDDK